MSGQLSFNEQRALLLEDVAVSMENVLQNLNKLNRSLEGVIAVGNEFSHVEGLWSQFEGVMGRGDENAETSTEPAETAAAAAAAAAAQT